MRPNISGNCLHGLCCTLRSPRTAPQTGLNHRWIPDTGYPAAAGLGLLYFTAVVTAASRQLLNHPVSCSPAPCHTKGLWKKPLHDRTTGHQHRSAKPVHGHLVRRCHFGQRLLARHERAQDRQASIFIEGSRGGVEYERANLKADYRMGATRKTAD
jgi:hypothetical protein